MRPLDALEGPLGAERSLGQRPFFGRFFAATVYVKSWKTSFMQPRFFQRSPQKTSPPQHFRKVPQAFFETSN